VIGCRCAQQNAVFDLDKSRFLGNAFTKSFSVTTLSDARLQHQSKKRPHLSKVVITIVATRVGLDVELKYLISYMKRKISSIYFFSLLLAKFKISLMHFSWLDQLKTRDVINPRCRLAGRPPRFTLFTSLPPEIRFIIWRLSRSSRVVEILESDVCAGFYSQAALPAASHICRVLRQAVEALYPSCFGSFL